MRSSPFLLLLATLVLNPPVASGESTSLRSNDSPASFDEIDAAAQQTLVTTQARAFLDILHDHWGDSPERVRTSIARDADRNDRGTLVYLHDVANHGALEGYEFRGDSLVRGRYVLLQRPVRELNEFIGYYDALRRTLTDTFGDPALDRIVWDNDLYKPLPEYWGVAVMIGHLHYHASWTTPEGTIVLELSGDHHSKLVLEYTSYRAGVPT